MLTSYRPSALTIRLIAASTAFLVLAILLLVGLPQSAQLLQTNLIASNNSNNKVVLATADQVLEQTKLPIIPQSKDAPAPTLSATAAIVQDMGSGTVLFSKVPDKQVPIASTTKIMTALVGAGYFSTDSVLTVTPSSLVSGSSMGLQSGEKITFRNALYGLMLNSGNDAAYTIAENYPGGLKAFIAAMNLKASQLGMENTHFDNPAGFDSPGHYSSAADVAKMAIVAQGNPYIARVVATKDAQVTSVDKSAVHTLRNLNQLLGLPGVLGMKTGTTPAAKENLVTVVERDEHKIMMVVLGSNDRFGETKALIDWTYGNFIWTR